MEKATFDRLVGEAKILEERYTPCGYWIPYTPDAYISYLCMEEMTRTSKTLEEFIPKYRAFCGFLGHIPMFSNYIIRLPGIKESTLTQIALERYSPDIVAFLVMEYVIWEGDILNPVRDGDKAVQVLVILIEKGNITKKRFESPQDRFPSYNLFLYEVMCLLRDHMSLEAATALNKLGINFGVQCLKGNSIEILGDHASSIALNVVDINISMMSSILNKGMKESLEVLSSRCPEVFVSNEFRYRENGLRIEFPIDAMAFKGLITPKIIANCRASLTREHLRRFEKALKKELIC